MGCKRELSEIISGHQRAAAPRKVTLWCTPLRCRTPTSPSMTTGSSRAAFDFLYKVCTAEKTAQTFVPKQQFSSLSPHPGLCCSSVRFKKKNPLAHFYAQACARHAAQFTTRSIVLRLHLNFFCTPTFWKRCIVA